ncbi:MerR family transcriptional regulator [Hyphomonas johnsonii MHS-2]|uniref:MerR family transcriptional regulator n=2 Tax=Hyphomonas johnsonii TaxID=81031 RepID=A0A059FNS7_9PROT|nr:MerR family transcriptional regulator [Hyphomonas johnsonii MHS-2]
MTDITIGRLSSATGVKVETIRYYEKIGLMPDPPRTEGGQRVYSPDHQDRLAFIKRSRDLGFPITAVRSLLGLNDEPPSCGEVQAITMSHLETIKTKIADLKRLQKTLNAIVLDCEDGESPDCPIIHALSATASSK